MNVRIGILAGNRRPLALRQELDTLVSLEVVLHPEPLAAGIDPHVGMRRVPVHVPPTPRDSTVTHEDGHLMRRLRRQSPEVPLHVVIAKVVVGTALLRVDEVGELRGVANEKDGSVVADHVVIAVLGVELERKYAWVTSSAGGAQLAGDCREARN